MSTSLYFAAERVYPLSEGERTAVAAVQARYPFGALLARLGTDEFTYDGEELGVWADKFHEPGTIFAGSAKLPSRGGAALAAAQHWCALLSEVRATVLPDAAWRVHIDDYDIAWSEQRREFDPTV